MKRNQDATNDGNNMFEALAKADLNAVTELVTSNNKLVKYIMIFVTLKVTLITGRNKQHIANLSYYEQSVLL